MLLPEKERKLCPHIEDPFEGCYCNEMSSQDVEHAIYFCANHYESCEIYVESCSQPVQSVLPQDDINGTPS